MDILLVIDMLQMKFSCNKDVMKEKCEENNLIDRKNLLLKHKRNNLKQVSSSARLDSER
jgi:hypothetical protein